MPNQIYNDENMTETYTTNTEKANALATHFENIHKLTHNTTSIMESIVNNIYNEYDNTPLINFDQNTPANFTDKHNYNQQNTTTIREFFTSEITQIIKTRNTEKTSGNDKSSNYVLKKMPKSFITALVIIFNHIINIQYYPNAWKFGVITAIPKPKKDITIVTSYRPITQLSSESKILEKNGNTNTKIL